jgi:prepilin-type N-terminal cleavage/methylation domain-containing protein
MRFFFAVLWVFCFFGSELPSLVSLGKIWIGQGTYTFLYDAIAANYDGISLGFSSFFFVKILVPVSFSAVLMVGAIRSRERIAELIHLRASWGFLRSSLPKTKKGFTIVELVIVIGVIGILSGILIPTFVNVTKNAEAAALKSNLANAFSSYVADAADGTIDEPSKVVADYNAAKEVYTIELVGQNETVLKSSENKMYQYKNGEWDIVNLYTGSTGKVAKDKDKTDVSVKYGGFEVLKITAA